MAGNVFLGDSLIFNGSQNTAVYLYHQVNDLSSHFGVDTFGACFAECLDLVHPQNKLFWPVSGGSQWINSTLTQKNWAGGHKLWAYDINQLPCDLPLLWCAANHNFQPSWQIVIDSVAHFFSQKIQSVGGCSVVNSANISAQPEVCVFPNPVNDALNIQVSSNNIEPMSIEIFDTIGHLKYSCTTRGSNTIPMNEIIRTSGLYLVQIKQKNIQIVKKIMYITK